MTFCLIVTGMLKNTPKECLPCYLDTSLFEDEIYEQN
jgi:hypothetical protein